MMDPATTSLEDAHEAITDAHWGKTAADAKYPLRVLNPIKVFKGNEVTPPVSETGCTMSTKQKKPVAFGLNYHPLKAQHVPILLAEQNAHFALEIADCGYVIDKGLIPFSGTRNELQQNEEVKNATCLFSRARL